MPESGQGHTFVVRRSDGSDSKEYVLKRLKNPKREDYFEREIRAYMTLDHPNVLKVLDHGRTPKGKPFLITEYCTGGSLAQMPQFGIPAAGLRFFEQVVAGVAHAHEHQPPIYHLDLKPENIILEGGSALVCDFGICFIEDGQFSLTKEGPRGSIYYCAPELRGPKISGTSSLFAADVYSLGKVLYWLFTGEVYDGHEEDYGNEASRQLAHVFPSYPQFAFVDELVSKTVRRNPSERIASAVDLLHRVRRVAERIDAGGRVLDLRIPQRCLYCAEGHYRAAHEIIVLQGLVRDPRFPEIEARRAPDNPPYPEQSVYAGMRNAAGGLLGTRTTVGIPLLLICDYCGNVQYFRLDQTPDRHGENWRP
ncbi:MAG: serine/threonine-protein kinase [Bryobacteraceae bacterium]